MNPTEQQEAIWDAMSSSGGGLLIRARAGTGKTYTLIEGLNGLLGNIAFVAFNRNIAKEAEQKAPRGVLVKTADALGLRALVHAGYAEDVDNQKIYKFLRNSKVPDEDRAEVKRLVDLARYNLAETEDDFVRLCKKHGVLPEEMSQEGFLACAAECVEWSAENPFVVDYPDMTWLPQRLGVWSPKFDVLVVDEVQDLNDCQIEFLSRQGKRVIAAGDDLQSIYAFRGVDDEAMDKWSDICESELPLTITWRCDRAIVNAAQTYAPDLQARPQAGAGAVETVSAISPSPQDFVLCRRNAPLVSLFFERLRERKPSKYLGRNPTSGLGREMKAVLGKSPWTSWEKKLSAWRERKLQRLKENRASDTAISMFADRAAVMHIVALRSRSLSDFEKECRKLNLQNQAKDAVVLSTIHQVKGLEAERVLLLEWDLMPAKWAREPWEKQQERNLIYVAYTRAKSNLVLQKEKQDVGAI